MYLGGEIAGTDVHILLSVLDFSSNTNQSSILQGLKNIGEAQNFTCDNWKAPSFPQA
jgi:hypothetical protein